MRRGPTSDRLVVAYRELLPTLRRAGIRTIDDAVAHPVYGPCVCNLARAYQRRAEAHPPPDSRERQVRMF
jgi:hypothetical protein